MTTSSKFLLAAQASLISAMIHGTAFANNAFGEIPSESDGFAPDSGAGGIRSAVLSIFRTVLSFLALVAVIVVVIAGIRLILSQGEEEQKEQAKKTIFYAVLGLLVVLLARVIVSFFITLPANR